MLVEFFQCKFVTGALPLQSKDSSYTFFNEISRNFWKNMIVQKVTIHLNMKICGRKYCILICYSKRKTKKRISPTRWKRTTPSLDGYRFEACTPDHRGSCGHKCRCIMEYIFLNFSQIMTLQMLYHHCFYYPIIFYFLQNYNWKLIAWYIKSKFYAIRISSMYQIISSAIYQFLIDAIYGINFTKCDHILLLNQLTG